MDCSCQAPLSMGFSRQEYWSRLPYPSPGYLPNPGIEPESFMSPTLAGGFFTTSATWEAQIFLFFFGCATIVCGILVPQPSIESRSIAVKIQLLTTGPPGDSLELICELPS